MLLLQYHHTVHLRGFIKRSSFATPTPLGRTGTCARDYMTVFLLLLTGSDVEMNGYAWLFYTSGFKEGREL